MRLICCGTPKICFRRNLEWSDLSCFGEKEGLPVEAFAKVKEMFNHLDWLDPVNDAALHMLQKINTSNIAPGDMRRKCRHGLQGFRSPKAIPKYQERSRSQSSSSCDYDNPLAQKTSPHGSMDASDSQSMMVFANSKQDPPKLVFENQTSLPASTTRNLLPDNDTCNDYQSMDVPMSPPSTVQDPIQTSSTEALVPTKVMNLSSAPHPPPPPQPQCTVVNSAMETPMLTPTPPPLPPPNCEPPRYPPPPPVSPSHLATSSTLEGPPTPPPLTLSQPPPPSTPPLRENPPIKAIPPPPPSPPFQSGQLAGPNPTPLVPSQAPPFPNSSTKQISSSGNSLDIPSAPHPPPLTKNSFTVPPAPPPPTQNSSALPSAPPPTLPGKDGLGPGLPSPPLPPLISPGNAKGRGLTRRMGSNSGSNKKLKPLHWLKLSRAVQGSLWAEAQTSDDATKAPEIDMLELENLFAASVPASDSGRMPGQHSSNARKQERVQLGLVLALEESVLDIDQVENLIKFCPTKKRWNYLRVIMEKKIS